MKHIKKFESYRISKKREEIIKESVIQVNDIYKVRTMVDIPQSMINAYVKKVKDNTGKNLRQFFGDVDIAEEIVKYVTMTGLDADKIAANALMGGAQGQGQSQTQTQMEPQAQTEPMGDMPQAQAQGQAAPQGQAQGQAAPQAQAQGQPQVQVQAEAQPQAQGQGQGNFEEVQGQGQAQGGQTEEEGEEEKEEGEEELPL